MVTNPEKLQKHISPFFITISSGYKRYPNLAFDGIYTFPIEIFQRKTLFYLFKQQFNPPAFTINAYKFSESDSRSFVSNENCLSFLVSANR